VPAAGYQAKEALRRPDAPIPAFSIQWGFCKIGDLTQCSVDLAWHWAHSAW